MSGSLWKGEGTGNDFILGLGTWAERLAADEALIRALCDRRRGIGADGVMALMPESGGRLRMIYHNGDGSEARFCANGSRLAALAASHLLEMGASIELETDWARIPAEVEGEMVRLQLPAPESETRGMLLSGEAGGIRGDFLRLGVPHFFIEVSEETLLRGGETVSRAPTLKNRPEFGPEGSNISIIARTAAGELRIRSFEQGVAEEVLSCGSAMASAGWLYSEAGKAVEILPRSGDRLRVLRSEGGHPPSLEGPARLVARIEDFSPV